MRGGLLAIDMSPRFGYAFAPIYSLSRSEPCQLSLHRDNAQNPPKRRKKSAKLCGIRTTLLARHPLALKPLNIDPLHVVALGNRDRARCGKLSGPVAQDNCVVSQVIICAYECTVW